MHTHLVPSPENKPTAILVWASRIQSLTFSTALHAILILLLGGTVILQNKKSPPPDFQTTGRDLVVDEPIAQPPPPTKPTLPGGPPSNTNPTIPNPENIQEQFAVLIAKNPSPTTFSMPNPAPPGLSLKPINRPPPLQPPGKAKTLDPKIAAAIAITCGGWPVGGRSTFGQPIRNREFEFTAFVAKYQGGDWDSTVELEDGAIWKGSLPNLLYVIGKLSRNKLRAEPVPVPLELTSEEIFAKKPPFIWFTGHRDFHLTDQEVEVLGEYLRRGGCIWGDSSLPGQRSRFDIAFRREMRRLVPDPNQPWEPLPANHPIFTRTYYPEIRSVPAGMNFHTEPVYTLLGYGGEIAVIYTANDYGDMWQFGLDEKKQIDLGRDDKKRFVAVNEGMWHRRNLYFRNVEPKALHDTYKFGTNIIIHLLTRWEDKIRTVPTM